MRPLKFKTKWQLRKEKLYPKTKNDLDSIFKEIYESSYAITYIKPFSIDLRKKKK